MTTHDLFVLNRRLIEEQRWANERWFESNGSAHAVAHLLRIWSEAAEVAAELRRRFPPAAEPR
jgi:hypothetical protein